MAAQHTERYDDITLQIAHQAQRSADLYSDDARRAWLTAQNEPSIMEAVAAQMVMSSKIASDAMQIRTGVQTPPIVKS